ncbi:MAG: preprotein translocase subunit YajC [Lachnospiraceae bacterium]|nr:preprotein translocase subunit YajC [Lachnospiraceae bacterium]MBR4769069.1 preprotein translocase subunit YajC [Lachnospiraceae bacterium]
MIFMYLGVMVLFFGVMYFIAIRPEKKREKEKKELLSTLAVGDTVLTTAGFYGVVIDITSDMVIVEFGNNKNCRIPMQKAAIVELEHPEGYVAPEPEKTEAPEKPLRKLFGKKDKKDAK